MLDAFAKILADENVAIMVLSFVCAVLFWSLFKLAGWWREDIRKYNEDMNRMSASLERITVVLENINGNTTNWRNRNGG